VTVPAECWKVVVVAPVIPGSTSTSGDELASVRATARVIAVVMPNDEGTIKSNWTAYRTSASDVEQRTGYRFFDRLLPDVGESLRQRVDQTPVAAPRLRAR
jgi:DNA/RNA endonuclease G (NUC1)